MVKRYKNRYERPRVPAPANVPVLKSIDAVISHMAKRRAFVAYDLHWEDRDGNGEVVSCESFTMRAMNICPQGVKRAYVVYESRPDCSSYTTLIEVPLFVHDHKSDQWYRNAAPEENTENHPCFPCVPPDKSVIALPHMQLRYLIHHGVMGLMEAKLAGKFELPKLQYMPLEYLYWDPIEGITEIQD